MVNITRHILLFFLFLLLAACSPTPTILPTQTDIPALQSTPTLRPTPSANPTLTSPQPITLPPLPTPFFPTLPGELVWPIKDANDLKKQLRDAPLIVVKIDGFRSCPFSYYHQDNIDEKSCSDMEFELGDPQRQQLISAIDENRIQNGELPEEFQGIGSPTTSLAHPQMRVTFILPKFRIHLVWATEKSFRVFQIYYPSLPQNTWDIPPELDDGGSADVGFLQEKPLLYQAVRALLPKMVFPPEYLGHLLEYERVVAEYDEKKCEYGNDSSSVSLVNFLYDLVDASVPVNEPRSTGNPRVIFTFSVRGQAYPLEIWENGSFSYREKIYKYTQWKVGKSGINLPPLKENLNDVLLSLNGVECKAP